MKTPKNCLSGFTLLETLLAISIVSFVSVTSVYMLFLSLNLRDLTLATTKTQEAIRIFERSLRQAVLSAQNISGGGGSIFIRSQNECWSFVYDNIEKNVLYSKISQNGCTPNPSPTSLFFAPETKINSISFSFSPITSGGQTVKVDGLIKTILPFDVYETTFSETLVNLID